MEEIGIRNALKNAFLKTNLDLQDSAIDTTFSGSTAVLVYLNGLKINCANIGDSRAIICRQLGSGGSSN
jgi:serine/threonine protein phosphatase PrpC